MPVHTSTLKLAALSGAVLGLFLIAAPARAACPDQRNPNAPGVQPMPGIVFYSINRTSAPVNYRNKETREVSVVGGDPSEGNLRFDLRLSADVPSHCILPVEIVDRNVTENDRRNGRLGIVTDLINQTSGNGGALQTDGSATTSLVVPTKALLSARQRRLNLGIRIGFNGQIMPFDLDWLGLPPLVSTVSSPTTASGQTVTVTTTLPASVTPGAITGRVQYSVTPAGVGSFQLLDGGPIQETLGASWVETFTPPRATIKFIPDYVPTPTTATITARLMGQDSRVTLQIQPGVSPCEPKVSVKPTASFMEYTIINTARTDCPTLRVEVGRAVNGAMQNSIVRQVQPIRPSPVQTRAPTMGVTLSQPQAATLANLQAIGPAGVSTPTSFAARYQINPLIPIPAGAATRSGRAEAALGSPPVATFRVIVTPSGMLPVTTDFPITAEEAALLNQR